LGSTCRTAISSNESRVRLHLTNFGGDNFRVTARLSGVRSSTVVTTGIMTMWKRIDVEYHQMRPVWLVPVSDVVRGLEPAFVQLDFTRAIDLAHRSYLTNGPDYETAAATLVRRLFRHAGQPGWFLLVAADLETSLGRRDPRRTAYTGAGTLHAFHSGQWLAIPSPLVDDRGRRATPATIKLKNGSDTLTFVANARTEQNWPAAGYTGIAIEPLTYFNVLDPDNGSVDHAHRRPNRYLPMAQPGFQGLGFGPNVECEVTIGLRSGAYGITPPIRRGRTEYFAGRSIVFMGRFNSADESLQTIIHELCHAFGFAHSCGRTAADPSSGHACTMAILDYWVFRPGTGTLQRWRHPPRGAEFCEYHLRGLRETHLEENPALWRWS
jgi:hypothetical protein